MYYLRHDTAVARDTRLRRHLLRRGVEVSDNKDEQTGLHIDYSCWNQTLVDGGGDGGEQVQTICMQRQLLIESLANCETNGSS